MSAHRNGLAALLAIVASAAICVGCAQTDAGVTTKVKAKFAADEVVKAYQIDVDTRDHVVTLSGEVESGAAKQRALSLARQSEGVRDVIDHIHVGQGTAALPGEHNAAPTSGQLDRDRLLPSDRPAEAGHEIGDATRDVAEKTKAAARDAGEALTDGTITAAVKSRLVANAAADALKINVDTTDHVVTLAGTVPSAADKAAALRAARETKGVREVKDRLVVAGR
jgi:osmotically-inducible protein OsmY